MRIWNFACSLRESSDNMEDDDVIQEGTRKIHDGLI